MAELNLKQIIDRLNTEFTGDNRKLVFWYDAGAEFAEDIDALELENAKILKVKFKKSHSNLKVSFMPEEPRVTIEGIPKW